MLSQAISVRTLYGSFMSPGPLSCSTNKTSMAMLSVGWTPTHSGMLFTTGSGTVACVGNQSATAAGNPNVLRWSGSPKYSRAQSTCKKVNCFVYAVQL